MAHADERRGELGSRLAYGVVCRCVDAGAKLPAEVAKARGRDAACARDAHAVVVDVALALLKPHRATRHVRDNKDLIAVLRALEALAGHGRKRALQEVRPVEALRGAPVDKLAMRLVEDVEQDIRALGHAARTVDKGRKRAGGIVRDAVLAHHSDANVENVGVSGVGSMVKF